MEPCFFSCMIHLLLCSFSSPQCNFARLLLNHHWWLTSKPMALSPIQLRRSTRTSAIVLTQLTHGLCISSSVSNFIFHMKAFYSFSFRAILFVLRFRHTRNYRLSWNSCQTNSAVPWRYAFLALLHDLWLFWMFYIAQHIALSLSHLRL